MVPRAVLERTAALRGAAARRRAHKRAAVREAKRRYGLTLEEDAAEALLIATYGMGLLQRS